MNAKERLFGWLVVVVVSAIMLGWMYRSWRDAVLPGPLLDF